MDNPDFREMAQKLAKYFDWDNNSEQVSEVAALCEKAWAMGRESALPNERNLRRWHLCELCNTNGWTYEEHLRHSTPQEQESE
jgi:hypothetical protein